MIQSFPNSVFKKTTKAENFGVPQENFNHYGSSSIDTSSNRMHRAHAVGTWQSLVLIFGELLSSVDVVGKDDCEETEASTKKVN